MNPYSILRSSFTASIRALASMAIRAEQSPNIRDGGCQ
jgi:hypothetical protein